MLALTLLSFVSPAQDIVQGYDKSGSKYAGVGQINSENFSTLKVAWTWNSPDEQITLKDPKLKTWVWESTPVLVDSVLYISTSMSQVAAVNALTGKSIWVYDPQTWKNGIPSNNGFVHRGITYWSSGNDKRIILATGDGYLIALNALDGKPVENFGNKGRIDLTTGLGRTVDRKLYGVSSPAIISRDVIIVGSKVNDVPLTKLMPPGDVRGFDVRTGKQKWVFHAIPQKGEFGSETWEEGSGLADGATNVWTLMSADDSLGYVYLPFSTPSNNNYGGERPGDNLFGESLVCLDVLTGKRVWHFQMVHHGLWDYDLPAAPNLIDIVVDGKPIKAVAQVSKQGFTYVFDRINGKPVWPIQERAVPQSTVPGEKSAATQPFPTKPLPFDRQGMSTEDLIDFTPKLKAQALGVFAKYNSGPLFTPPALDKPTIQMPGIAGGASWSGAAFDPSTQILYIPSNTMPYAVKLVKSKVDGYPLIGETKPVESIDEIPIWKPPYARITAVDMQTGLHKWVSPVGDIGKDNAILKTLNLPQLGRAARNHILLTETLLIVGQEGSTQRESGDSPTATFAIKDPKLLAYDKGNGKVVGEVPLPRNVTAAPMTYVLNGKQYIAITTGGANLTPELIILTLP
ncbi:pyrroloquinoline quinone-dependent dehydrogenase [Dyadobacter sp. CY345]|uniref:pyrroloquinoline quinone-dependent dehydrogenase n=1 Tax=Dyadobacter sp. CY345 TaxID=2909335 RepID=UPI001F17FE04|nr:pyrroloquinoline quinone-dependent dehydrogenase [Dyadobacter sp. CY345]MCF2443269.1 pyrroloquinoline quinone-dependent dehydrogenase [Dyadobacter sp. CY345]